MTPRGKRVAIVQSNYIPWKGYFDLIAAVDEFVLYDQVQFTKNDWRNRNQIKTPQGLQWLSVPVGQDIGRRICDVQLIDARWQAKHWKTIEANYRRAPHFGEIAAWLAPLYLEERHERLSSMNRMFIEAICRWIGISTKIVDSSCYAIGSGRTERLIEICEQAGAAEYLSGPKARAYIEAGQFERKGIALSWFDYTGTPGHPQQWGDYLPGVSIIDLLFNCGDRAVEYMQCGRSKVDA